MQFLNRIKQMFGGKSKGGPHAVPMARIDVDKRFELLGRTGQGSMSKVFRARDKKIGRTVCLKVLDKEKTAKFEARFLGLNRPPEGMICASLKHKNIVQTYECGVTPKGEPCLVMELIDGMGMNFLIETKSASLNGKRIDLLIQMADGLEYIHEQGYIHRDICPRNLMVTSEGVLKYIDFGLAVPKRPEFFKPGNRTGTPNYLAPEIIKRVSTDQRVDLFALGVTAYEMLTGQLPWEKTSGSMQTLQSHVNSNGKDPREFRKELDDATVEFLIKAIAREPRERFQTAGEFRDALRALPRKDW